MSDTARENAGGVSVFDKFKIYTIPELTEEEKRPPEFIVDEMIPVGMTFLSGAPKIRKSFLAYQLGIAVATNNKFLGLHVTPCDVLYFDLEGSTSRTTARSERFSIQIPRNMRVIYETPDKLSNGLVTDIRQMHREIPTYRLFVIDTYSRARGRFSTYGANAYDNDVALLEPIQRMALEENIAVLFVHHDKKGAGMVLDDFERLSGTMGISGSCDSVLNLVANGKRFDGKATLTYTPRDAKGGEKQLAFDEFHCEWTETQDTRQDLLGNPVCAWIITHAGDKGKEGLFFTYEEVFRGAYQFIGPSPGDAVRDALEPYITELFTEYRIGVQMGVKSNGKRGVRIISLL